MSQIPNRRIRVLIVEDSPLQGLLLKHILGQHADIQVVGVCRDGAEALRSIGPLDPDVVTMDMRLPGMDGVETTRALMAATPRPVLVVATSVEPDTVVAQEMLGAGALDIFPKPSGLDGWESAAAELAERVRALSAIRPRRRPARQAPLAETGIAAPRERPQVIAIAASTGGPQALRHLLGDLSHGYPVPLLVVQHISSGFGPGFVQWLAECCALPVRLAEHGASAELPGVTIARDDRHVRVAADHRLELSAEDPVGSVRPRADLLLASVAQVYGAAALGIVLTGIGRDGAQGLLEMRRAGAHTIAQDEASSVVYGMPKAAAELGAAELVLDLDGIVAHLRRLGHLVGEGPEGVRP